MLWRTGKTFLVVFLSLLPVAYQNTSGFAADIDLTLPVDCDLGKDCFVQNYVDLDPGPGVLTAACNRASYDGHKGTDIRVLDTGKTADVVASAPGIVKALRNDMPDRLVLSDKDREQVGGKECGNGVVLSHADGWETQYCHLRAGSVSVVAGQRVERGAKVGEVGYSGSAAFPHVHLSVRRNGKVVDPFLGSHEMAESRRELCASGAGAGLTFDGALWQAGTDALLEDSEGTIIQTGFADSTVATIDLETGRATQPNAQSGALVFFARLINLKKGDRVALRLVGPQGVLAESDGKPIDRQKAQWVSFAGRKLRTDAWPSGEYFGTATVVRDGQVFRQQTTLFSLQN